MNNFLLMPDGTTKSIDLRKGVNNFLNLNWVEDYYLFSNDKEGARRAYAASVLVNRCISVKANVFSTLPKRFVLSDDTEISRDHIVRREFGKRKTKLWRQISQDYDVYGFFVLEPYQDDYTSRIKFKRINPATIEVIRDSSGILGFEQRIKGRTVADWYANELVYVWQYNPIDDLSPSSPLTYVFKNIITELHITDFVKSYFENGGTPAGILTTDQLLRPAQTKQYAKEWKDNYGGTENNNKVAVVGGGLKYQQLTPTIKDMVVDEIGEANAKKVCQIFGVPMSLALETAGQENRAEKNSDRESFYRETIIPTFAFIADELSEQAIPFLTSEEIFIECDDLQIDVLQNDRKIITERSTQGFKSGVRSLNEARRMEQLPEIKGGDCFFIGGRLIPESKLSDSEAINLILEGQPLNQSFEPNKTEPVNPDGEKQSNRLRNSEKKAVPITYNKRAIVSDLRKWKKKALNKGRDSEFETEFIPDTYVDFIKIDLKVAKTLDQIRDIFDGYIDLFENQLTTEEEFELMFKFTKYHQGVGYYQQEVEDVLNEYFRKNLKEDIISYLSNNDSTLLMKERVFKKRNNELFQRLYPLGINIALSGMEKGYDELGNESKNVDRFIESLKQKARDYTSKFIDDITNSTIRNVQEKLQEWTNAGGDKNGFIGWLRDQENAPANWVAGRLEYFFSPDRSVRNGEDFTNELNNTGMLDTFEALAKGARWLTMLDERVCNTCRPLHGVLGSSTEGFINPEDKQVYFAPAHSKCRCFYEPTRSDVLPL